MYNMKTRFRIMLEGPVIECDKGRRRCAGTFTLDFL